MVSRKKDCGRNQPPMEMHKSWHGSPTEAHERCIRSQMMHCEFGQDFKNRQMGNVDGSSGGACIMTPATALIQRPIVSPGSVPTTTPSSKSADVYLSEQAHAVVRCSRERRARAEFLEHRQHENNTNFPPSPQILVPIFWGASRILLSLFYLSAAAPRSLGLHRRPEPSGI